MAVLIPRERIERVRKLYLRGASDAQIQSIVSREFECSCRAVRRYIKRVRDKYTKREIDGAAAANARAESMFLEIYRKARKAGDLKTMAVAAHRLAELHGAIAPKRHEVTGKGGGPLQSETVARVVMMPPLDDEPTPGDPVETTPGTADAIPGVDGA